LGVVKPPFSKKTSPAAGPNPKPGHQGKQGPCRTDNQARPESHAMPPGNPTIAVYKVTKVPLLPFFRHTMCHMFDAATGRRLRRNMA
jgi:hypothetical protein